MRNRITHKLCCSSDHSKKYQKLYKVCHKNNIEIVQKECIKNTKQPFIKVFGKLIPITVEEVSKIKTYQTIIWQ